MPRIKQQFESRDLKCAQWMLKKIREIRPKFKQPNLSQWAIEIRLMRERDGRGYDEIYQIFTWANNHHFWKVNILSPAKLRKQFDRLALQMEAESRKKPMPQKPEIQPRQPERHFEIRSSSGERTAPPKEFYQILAEIGIHPQAPKQEVKKPKPVDHRIVRKRHSCSRCRKKTELTVFFEKDNYQKPFCLDCAQKEVRHE